MKTNYFLLLGLILIALIFGGCQQEKTEPVQETKTAEEEQDEGFTSDDKVVTINGKVLNYEDLQFYQLMNKVDIELNRAQEQQNLQGEELSDKQAYWDEQIKYHDNFNVNLSKMIEQHTMYLLAKEKGLNALEAAVSQEIAAFTAKVKENDSATKLIASFPEDAYQNRLNRYFTEKLLTQQIYETLKADVVKEKPNASEKEIAYDTSKNYEDLYKSQISTVDIKINAAEY
jgi:hypothetical protein